MSNPLFVLDLLFEILDGLYWVNLKSDGITWTQQMFQSQHKSLFSDLCSEMTELIMGLDTTNGKVANVHFQCQTEDPGQGGDST